MPDTVAISSKKPPPPIGDYAENSSFRNSLRPAQGRRGIPARGGGRSGPRLGDGTSRQTLKRVVAGNAEWIRRPERKLSEDDQAALNADS
jgi:hypothetical protein